MPSNPIPSSPIQPTPLKATPPSAQELAEQVRHAFAAQQPLHIIGGGSKAFYGHSVVGDPLPVHAFQGIINYEPSELVITAKAGTPLRVIETTLAEQGQMLGFEPPHFGASATLGGTVACGLSGPRRPYSGAVRDFVLGVTLINGKGEILRFGGQVMKNVAGYDVSRLMCAAQGTLGVLLDISLKVVPKPACEQTLQLRCNQQQMQTLLAQLGRQPLPLSATALHKDQLHIRLSGTEPGVRAAATKIGGEPLLCADAFWHALKEQQHGFFTTATTYMRLSLPPAAPSVPDNWVADQLIEWGAAQRWIQPRQNSDIGAIMEWTAQQGGHATTFNRALGQPANFHPLHTALATLNERIKLSFDPARILNPGRLYPGQ